MEYHHCPQKETTVLHNYRNKAPVPPSSRTLVFHRSRLWRWWQITPRCEAHGCSSPSRSQEPQWASKSGAARSTFAITTSGLLLSHVDHGIFFFLFQGKGELVQDVSCCGWNWKLEGEMAKQKHRKHSQLNVVGSEGRVLFLPWFPERRVGGEVGKTD